MRRILLLADRHRKKIMAGFALILLVTVVTFGLFVWLFYISLADPSSSAPLYSGPILTHPLQKPLNSRFTHSTEAMEVVQGINLAGKNVVITGGRNGTGREAVRALTHAGATVTALARNVRRAEDNLRGISGVEVEYVDLLEPESIDAFAAKYVASGRPLHILINSAAIMATPFAHDRRGYERQFATNVLGHFQLTAQLYPALLRANGARVVNLSSRGHRAGGVNLDDIHFDHGEYSPMRAYAQTKTALVLFTVHLDDMLRDKNIRAFAVHPGPVPSTDLFAAGRVGVDPAYKVWFARLLAKIVRLCHVTEILNYFRRPNNIADLYKTVQQGGATTAYAAVSDDLTAMGGLYLEDCNVAVLVPDGSPAPFGVRPWALDRETAEKLWTLCEEMTGVRFGPDSMVQPPSPKEGPVI